MVYIIWLNISVLIILTRNEDGLVLVVLGDQLGGAVGHSLDILLGFCLNWLAFILLISNAVNFFILVLLTGFVVTGFFSILFCFLLFFWISYLLIELDFRHFVVFAQGRWFFLVAFGYDQLLILEPVQAIVVRLIVFTLSWWQLLILGRRQLIRLVLCCFIWIALWEIKRILLNDLIIKLAKEQRILRAAPLERLGQVQVGHFGRHLCVFSFIVDCCFAGLVDSRELSCRILPRVGADDCWFVMEGRAIFYFVRHSKPERLGEVARLGGVKVTLRAHLVCCHCVVIPLPLDKTSFLHHEIGSTRTVLVLTTGCHTEAWGHLWTPRMH